MPLTPFTPSTPQSHALSILLHLDALQLTGGQQKYNPISSSRNAVLRYRGCSQMSHMNNNVFQDDASSNLILSSNLVHSQLLDIQSNRRVGRSVSGDQTQLMSMTFRKTKYPSHFKNIHQNRMAMTNSVINTNDPQKCYQIHLPLQWRNPQELQLRQQLKPTHQNIQDIRRHYSYINRQNRQITIRQEEQNGFNNTNSHHNNSNNNINSNTPNPNHSNNSNPFESIPISLINQSSQHHYKMPHSPKQHVKYNQQCKRDKFIGYRQSKSYHRVQDQTKNSHRNSLLNGMIEHGNDSQSYELETNHLSGIINHLKHSSNHYPNYEPLVPSQVQLPWVQQMKRQASSKLHINRARRGQK